MGVAIRFCKWNDIGERFLTVNVIISYRMGA